MNNDNQQTNSQTNGQINSFLSDFNGVNTPWHTHNGGDNPQLDPNVSLLGFPVFQVSDASVAPTNLSTNGKFVFLVDFNAGTPHFYLWAYLVYQNASYQSISKWVKTQLT